MDVDVSASDFAIQVLGEETTVPLLSLPLSGSVVGIRTIIEISW